MAGTENPVLKRTPPILVLLWVLATLVTILAPTNPAAGFAAKAALAAMVLFGLLHCARRYGARGSLAFFIAAIVISNFYENLSIATGFPFGFYVHNAAMGPKLFLVPLIIGPGYFGGCYIAWALAETLLGDPARPRDRLWIVAMPIIASFIVVGWDICGDPQGATIAKSWTYAHGGAFFGVPLSNFFGWYLVTWTIFQVFALYVTAAGIEPRRVGRDYWYQASGFWAVIALQFPLLLLTAPQVTTQDASGWSWRSGDIAQTAVLTSIYTMLAAAVISAFVAARRVMPF